jgi:GNAT superfamily N-acetyltransferase
MRIQMEYPEAHKESLPGIIRFLRPAPEMSFILYSRLEEPTLDEAIREQVKFARQREGPMEWIVYAHDQPENLRSRLEFHGLSLSDESDLLMLPLAEADPSLLEPVKIEFRKLEGSEELAAVIEVEHKVWGGDFTWMYKRIGGHMQIPGFVSVYVAYVEDKPVSTGWTYFYPNSHFAGLWGGSTIREYRRQGFYTALLALRVQEAIARGYTYLIIDASEMSSPIARKHGFRHLSRGYSYLFPED